MGYRFALIGVAGYVATRHLSAIQAVNGDLVVAHDIHDSVGILDRYFAQAKFFNSFERFERFIAKIQTSDQPIDYLVICSPNYLHDTHIRFAMQHEMHVICEKPLCINPWNIDQIALSESKSQYRVNCILQMRLHPIMDQLRASIKKEEYTVGTLTYLTYRGPWYYSSWKGNESKSGGICMNIGIHLFDLLIYLFGDVIESKVHQLSHDRASGVLTFVNAKITWYLSIGQDALNAISQDAKITAKRSLDINGESFEFTQGFEDLHIKSYEKILAGHGYTAADTRASIEAVYAIRQAKLSPIDSDAHPLTSLPMISHPHEL